MKYFSNCTRCGDASFEHLSTHSHCYNCNYSPDEEHRHNEWHRLQSMHKQKEITKHYHSSLGGPFLTESPS